jgi:hypothetical protein
MDREWITRQLDKTGRVRIVSVWATIHSEAVALRVYWKGTSVALGSAFGSGYTHGCAVECWG